MYIYIYYILVWCIGIIISEPFIDHSLSPCSLGMADVSELENPKKGSLDTGKWPSPTDSGAKKSSAARAVEQKLAFNDSLLGL